MKISQLLPALDENDHIFIMGVIAGEPESEQKMCSLFEGTVSNLKRRSSLARKNILKIMACCDALVIHCKMQTPEERAEQAARRRQREKERKGDT